MDKVGCLVSTFNRATALRRSLPQIVALGVSTLVIDDASDEPNGEENWNTCLENKVHYLQLPQNRGLAAVLNIGVEYFAADSSVKFINYLQDDTDCVPGLLKIMAKLASHGKLITGHDAGEHPSFKRDKIEGMDVIYKWNCRATHLFASVDFWRSVMPIPTRELGAPKRTGAGRGLGSNVDWWIVKDSPNSCEKTKRPILCVPGLVRSFLHKAQDSCWNNEQKSGEDPPLRSYA
jgi:hypothetical protein